MELSLCLSGGGVRGVAHLGVLQKIQEKFHVDYKVISGTSSGAIIGAFLAAGYQPQAIFEIVQHTEFLKYFRPSFRGGFLDLKNFRVLFEKYLPVHIEGLKTPFYACVTNIETGKPEYLNSGNLFDTLIASSSLPLIFKTTIINDRYYMDGGLVNNLPIEPLQTKPFNILGINVNPLGFYKFDDSVRSLAMRVVHIASATNAQEKIGKCDYYIEPNDIEKIGVLDFKSITKAYEIGYDASIQLS